MNKIIVRKICKSFDGRTVINDFSKEFVKGRFYAIMGPSGAGKTTLLNIIAGLETADSGEVEAGRLLNELSANERADYRNKSIGFIFQNFYLNPYLTVEENVIVPMLINNEIDKKDRKKIAGEKLNYFDMGQYADENVKKLSGGEQQRVAIARAIANEPEVILADEPTGNLDETNEKIVFEHLKKLSEQGKIVIVVSHNEAVKNYADEIIELKKAGA